ncbi:MAG TPA: hypothetical protein VF574_02960 [Allosphingosinicella sp.]|jgi:hypothetical protein
MIEGPPPSPPAISVPAEVRSIVAWGDPAALIALRERMDGRGWHWATGNLGGKTAMLYLDPPQSAGAAEIRRLIDEINAGKYGKINAGYGLVGEAAVREEAALGVKRCGFPPAAMRISYSDTLQSDVITLETSDSRPVRSAFQCLYRIQRATGAFIQFKDRGAEKTWRDFSFAEDKRVGAEMARQWLAERGLDVPLPSYTPGREGLTRFARAIEGHCSVSPGSALEVAGSNTLTMNQRYMAATFKSPDRKEDLTCLLYAIAASDFERGGGFFGFFGNEIHETGKQP